MSEPTVRAGQETELDLLRVLAALAVIVMHLAPTQEPETASALGRAMFHVIPAAVTWCVPCFIMVSGRFLLDPARPLPTRKLFGQYLLRLVITFAFWSPLYRVYETALLGMHYGWRAFLSLSLTGFYHMWYLFLLAGLYLVTPVLRRIAEDEKTMKYFLLLFFAVNVLTEYVQYLPGIGWSVANALEYSHLHLVLGYTGYFMLGLYLRYAEFSPRAERAIYLAGLLCLLFTATAGLWLPAPAGEEQSFFQLYRKTNVVIESAALYLFFVRRVSRLDFSARLAAVLAGCARLSMGVYMAHVMVYGVLYELLRRSGSGLLSLPGAQSWLLFVIPVYLLSLAAAWLLKKIPVLSRM